MLSDRMIIPAEQLFDKAKIIGKCKCGGTIILDPRHKEPVCLSCGTVNPKRGKSDLVPTRYMVVVCPNCQAKKRKPRKVVVVEYNWRGYGYCPLCGFKFKFVPVKRSEL